DLDGSFTVPSPGLIQDGFSLVFTPSGNGVDPIAATPVFTPAGGTYNGSVDVTLSASSAGTSIYYTLDGTDPTSASTQYNGPISLSETTTVKAIASGEGFRDSQIATAEYIITNDFAFTLAFYVTDGVNSQNLIIGSDPGANSTAYVEELDQLAPPAPPDGAFDARLKVNGTSYFAKYFDNQLVENTARFEFSASNGNGPIELYWDAEALDIVGTFTIEDTFGGTIFSQDVSELNGFFAVPESGVISDAFNLVFTPNGEETDPIASTPVIMPEGGSSMVYEESVDVTITAETPGSSIYYTTDGSVPDTDSNLYTSTLTLTESSTVKAIAVANGFRQSFIAETKYVVKQRAETPQISPEAGTYVENVSVTISTGSEGANIYYTLDGSTPNEQSTVYDGPLSLSSSVFVQAIAGGGEFLPSDVAEAAYDILIIAEAPVVSPDAGTYVDEVEVTLSTPTEGASIFYTLDGSDPTVESSQYEGALVLTESTTVKAIAGGVGFVTSDIVEAVYEVLITAEQPMIFPESGTYVDVVEISMSTQTDGASIWYTTDGSTPTPNANSQLYTEAFSITESATVKAIAGGEGFATSEVTEAEYEVLITAEAPLFSSVAGTYADSVEIALSSETPGVSIYYTTDGEDPSTGSTLYTSPLLITETTTLKAIAAGDGYVTSDVSEAEYLIVDYYLDMQVSDENDASITLRLGTAGDASTIFNPLYDQLAPPPPPDGAFDARVKVDGVSYFTKYQPTIETVREWSLEFAPSSGGAPITITWDPAQLSSEGTFTLRDVVNGMFVDVDMRAQSELVVSDAFITELTLSHKLFVEIDQDYLFNWNLVSVPVLAEDNGYQSLFPLASEGTLFSFSVNYEAQETLEPGTGYWLRMDEDDTVTFTGEEISSSMLNLQANWNIIGSISEESVIEDPDQIVVPGTLFGFGINYVAEDRVESGRGYWLATFEAGDVTLVPSGGAGLAGGA
ncbi:MAG: chitobiase/beta-hexosaminidase C-terminal domain-containing protein, partial [Balneolaceae bacterium]